MTEHIDASQGVAANDYIQDDWDTYRQLNILTNHWDRPGWTPGRRSYHWILSVADVPKLPALATQCQTQLRDIPTLDFVPVTSLHITLQRAAFTDEMTPNQVADMVGAASMRCAAIPPPTLQIGPLAGSAGAVRFSVGPHAPLHEIRSAVRSAVADVRDTRTVPGRKTDFIPHVSIAYSNAVTSAQPVIERVAALRSTGCVAADIHAVD